MQTAAVESVSSIIFCGGCCAESEDLLFCETGGLFISKRGSLMDATAGTPLIALILPRKSLIVSEETQQRDDIRDCEDCEASFTPSISCLLRESQILLIPCLVS